MRGLIATAGLLLRASLVLLPGRVGAEPPPNPWPAFKHPRRGPAHAIGEYAAGCLSGGVKLPLDGPGYQVMRPSRHRYYGHPSLVDYVKALGKRVRRARQGVLLVGDLAQPRGGRAASGHASHQTGLDVDVWYAYPPEALRGPLPSAAREELTAEVIVHGGRVDAKRRAHVRSVLALAVADPRVDRVFVNAAVKQALCTAEHGERGWLRKLRPWYGHDDHFHVRLACAPDDALCAGQGQLPEGDGCDKLESWLRPAPPSPARVGPRTSTSTQKLAKEERRWPEACDALLEPDASAHVAPAHAAGRGTHTPTRPAVERAEASADVSSPQSSPSRP